jgi:hypothetical protein
MLVYACLQLGLARQVADLISKHINYVNAADPYGIPANDRRASSAAARAVKNWLTLD